MARARTLLAFIFFLALSGCVVNPVTGKRELSVVTPAQEISIGERQYVPAQQMQGGEYAVDEALSRYVSSVGNRLATVSGVDLPYEFVVLNNSVPNAWALPGGKIAINRGLLVELGSEAELAAVLGHEITHAAARHGARSISRGMLLQGALIAAAIGASNTEYAGAVVGAGQVAAGLITTKYGRDAEREADYYGTRFMAAAGYDPQAAVALQETFVRLSQGRQTSWMQGLFSSHPPSAERVANNKLLVRQLRAEGITADKLGKSEYLTAMRTINKDKDAYAAFDEARSEFGKNNDTAALAKVNAALKLQPKEAAFHGLRGDIRRTQGRKSDALINYNRAIGFDDGYYAYYLGRGLVRSLAADSGQGASLAKADLNKSVSLLPTAIAYEQLGKIAESEGNQDAALQYYEAASKSGGAAGQTALKSLWRIDLPRRPGEYLSAKVINTGRGPVLIVTNPTDVNVSDVVVKVDLAWKDGETVKTSGRAGSVSAQSSQQIRLRARDVPLVGARASIVSARVNSENSK